MTTNRVAESGLTDEQIEAIWHVEWDHHRYADGNRTMEPLIAFARAIEAAVRATPPTEAQEPVAPPKGWKWVAVNSGFEALMDALDRAQRKGYMPDAMADEWEAFNYDAAGFLCETTGTYAAPEPSHETIHQMREALTERLVSTLTKIAAENDEWGPFPEANNSLWGPMAIVEARRALKEYRAALAQHKESAA